MGDIVKLKYLSLNELTGEDAAYGIGIVIRTFMGGHHYDRHRQIEYLDPFGNLVVVDAGALEVIKPDEAL